MKKLLVAILILAWPVVQAVQAQSSLTAGEQKTLILLAEEEKLAHDFYKAMEEQWGVKVFTNIVEAEQRHLNRITKLAASQGVKLPKTITADKGGKFRDNKLQQFYDELLASGSQSMEAALRAGAHIEEADIQDLKQALETARNEELRAMYQNLLEGSGNHLRAFNKKLTAQGVAYQPVVLPQGDFEAIINAGGKGQGCQGQKAGKGGKGKGCCQGKSAQQGKGKCCQGGQKGNCQGKGQGKARS